MTLLINLEDPLMKRTTEFLISTLKHNRQLLKVIEASSIPECYNVGIVLEACDAIEAELRCRGM